ncbi:unnamed protein product [Rotaria socialis]|uniref:Uncharacterized protein n=2 Tax=Rotaria TaxID=231623 RepID=A0A8S3GCH5_9BILA|nr:unnamed protein product [Rotaria socialis]CAF5159117.1 unnamed protein product [Rotaria magnacalcarata]CAF4693752.1 unnamed protein product [Rotaria socialis]CAF4699502.1 unnamed protein product [Rotaria socialis]CAF4953475.1 unnamed protein product [Rotaria socialis]
MPSTNVRPSSIRPSRNTQNRVTAQIVRSATAPQRQFIMILTNNPILLQNTRAFQPPVAQSRQATGPTQNHANHHHHQTVNIREGMLNDLLRIELRKAARDYLSRTRREYPLHYVFDMSDIEIPQPHP